MGRNFVSARVSEATGLALGVHDGFQQHMSNAGTKETPIQDDDSSINIEATRQLIKEFEGRQ